MPKVQFEQDGDVGIITIRDPPLNLFSLELIAELTAATAEAESAPIRALLLCSEGEHFTAGAQVEEVFGNLPYEPQQQPQITVIAGDHIGPAMWTRDLRGRELYRRVPSDHFWLSKGRIQRMR